MATSRRDFFNAFRKPLRKEEATLRLRPPYASSESLFESVCVNCESKACVASCDEQIIIVQEDGTPTLSFLKSGCTFCEACAIACTATQNEVNVLSLDNTQNSEVLNARFNISTTSCVAHNGVICFSCKEPCIDDAILFNGMFNPIIDLDKCTACGFCLSRCPTIAIDFTLIPINEEIS
ncbi:MAG: Ferredoxin-type protein NapF (periplasmic nitrate reductase) [uncultured Sulfurovum sp.]|uniref:Ferredoxin-type protein NapF (Periplasmic nitrate reductase) n=1 Tax=uncultured Sulfurovum sp. TaxID=269237 RepID=A0A6S6SVR8_9BACT|nr:MAG: Ferredoxin-type protein NapF (periplasmic nitrate reductase) [uncultured Sulfurovum sp.]